MQIDLEKVLDELEKHNPVSIFLYGSRARTDATDESDYELGVLFPEHQYVKRSLLKEGMPDNVSVYPFKLEEFKIGNPDTPFNKNIYLQEIKKSGKTLRGEKVIEGMQVSAVTVLDVLMDVQFNLGYALGAVVAHRNESPETARMLFYKSCLFATRSLVVLKQKTLPTTYDEIVSVAQKLELGEFADLPQKALEVRKGAQLEPNDLFRNISFINQVIIPQIQSSDSDEELIK